MGKHTDTVEGPRSLSADATSSELDLVDILILLAKRKRTIAYVVAAGTLLGLLVSFMVPNTYSATTLLLPPQQDQSSAAMLLSQLNPLLAGLNQGTGAPTTSDLYVALLRSRSVADSLVAEFDLRRVYGSDTQIKAREKLDRRSDIRDTKEGIVEISVEDREPWRAAGIANAYVSELEKLTQTLAVTEASQRRLFYERQAVSAKETLSNAEVALKEIQEKTGLIALDEQARAIIESAAALKALIAAKEVQLQRMRLFATAQNPDLQGAEQELRGLRGQLAIVERRAAGGNGDIQLATAKVPAAGLEYIRRLRNLKYAEALYELLMKQLEAAKLDEAKNSAVIQVVDRAVEPETKSSPKRLLITVLSALISFFFAALWAVLLGAYERVQEDPERAARLHLLQSYLLIRNRMSP